MTVTISQEQRDRLYNEARLDLTGVGDIHIAFLNGNPSCAQEHADSFRRDMRLLDDLGWDEFDVRDSYALTMALDELCALLTYFIARADETAAEAHEFGDDETRDDCLDLRSVCTSVREVMEVR